MNKYIVLLAGILLSWGIQAQDLAPAKNPEQVKNTFLKMNASMNSFESSFRQTKEFSFMDRSLISTGQLYYQKTEKLRWEYKEPNQYILLMNGEKVRLIEDGKEKAYSVGVQQIFKNIKEVFIGCINGEILNSADYDMQCFENETMLQVKLIPKDEKLKEYIQSISIFMEKGKNQMSYLVLKDGSGDPTKIEFLESKINQAIASDVFTSF